MTPAQEIFDAVRKCRAGQVSNQVAQTLETAGLLRGVMHIGSAPKLRIVFARALKDSWLNADTYMREQLPPQASLRFATTFGVDFIISGQLPEGWADEKLAKRSDLFEDVYEAEVVALRRYRWGRPTKPSRSRSKAKLLPSLEDVAQFLADGDRATRLVYDSTRLPSLSCLALITTDGKELAEIWDHLEDDEKQPVRDIFRNLGNKVNMETATMDRDAIQLASDYAFCEFDAMDDSEDTSLLMPPMNRAYQWRRKMVERNGIQKVRLIPCAVMSESTDYYDELEESKARMSLFNPTTTLPYAIENGSQDAEIQFPIWNVAICGGSGSGKSVFAYVLGAALLKEHGYDVLFVNYKNSDDTAELDPRPRKEALEFAGAIKHIANREVSLVAPFDIERMVQAQEEASAYYTDCVRDVRPSYVLDSIFDVHQKKLEKNKQWKTFVFFDELLNQKTNLKQDMDRIKVAIRQWRTSGIYLGVIHQDLAGFWEDDSATAVVEDSTVILASKLPGHDKTPYGLLLERARKRPAPISPVTFDEVKGYQRGEFTFMPTQGGNSENPVRYRLPQYSFFNTLPKAVPEEWKWGSTVKI